MNFNFYLMSDEIFLVSIIVILLLLDFLFNNKKIIGYAFIFLTTLLLIYILYFKREGILLNGSYIYDGISWISKIIILIGGILVGFLSLSTIKTEKKHIGAYFSLVSSSILGMFFLVSSKELITLYIGLELATISLYALTAIYRSEDKPLEAGIKYVILGALSSGILLYGLSLIYGSTSTTYIDKILQFTAREEFNSLFIIGLIFVLIGILFKLSAVPMHVWTPDIYEGAPTPITAFISVASKTAGFIFAIRILSYTFIKISFVWVTILVVISILTMTIGNLIAIPQKNVKRLLAYSTISQAGYILVGFVGASIIGISSVIFYLLVYTLTNILAFAVVIGFSNITASDNLEDYEGLAQKEPLLGFCFLLALLSLAGIPPLAGFVGKFYLFYAAMQKGHLILVIIAALNSTIALYYYLHVLKRMYILKPKKNYDKIKLPFSIKIVLFMTSAGIIALGIYPTKIIDITISIAQKIFM